MSKPVEGPEGLHPLRKPPGLSVIAVCAAAYALIGVAVLRSGPWEPPPAYVVDVPSGLAFGLLILFGVRIWPAVLLGAGLVTAATGGAPVQVVTSALGAAAEVMVAAAVLRRLQFTRSRFDLRGMWSLVAAASAAGATGACFGTLGLGLSLDRTPAQLAVVWWMWMVGHGLGWLLVGSPFALARGRVGGADADHLRESSAVTLALALAAQLTFSSPTGGVANLPVEYITYPFLIWVALRGTPFWVALANMVLVLSALIWTGLGMGPLFRGDMSSSLIWVGFFGLVTWVSTMGLAAIVSERTATERALRVATRDAKRADRAKSDFLANMSHEIRTPMNGVIGMADLLLDTRLKPEQVQFAETIRTSAYSLLSVINDVLDFSKIEAGVLSVDPVPFDLRIAISDVVQMLEPRARDRNVDVSVLYPGDCPRHVVGDPGRIRQVLTNLIGNGVKFTEDGRLSLRIDVVDRSDTGVRLRFEVEDTGIGVDPEKIPTLFDKFTQADGSTTRRYGGTGLGLAISRHLVELMGGSIGARSRVGVGSVFWFELPLEIAEPPAFAPASVDLAHLRVLVVDDCLVNLRLVSEQLRGVVARVDATTRGLEGAEMLRRAASKGDPYGIVLLDYQMPDLDGPEVAALIRADAEVGHTPLVMLTSFQSSGDSLRLQRAGFSGYLVKPVVAHELVGVIAAVCQRNPYEPQQIVTRFTLAELRQLDGPTEGASRLDPPTVLVAEDNPVNQLVARSLLEKLGYVVEIAADGREAVERVRQGNYPLILMDCEMPGLDGYEATAQIRALQADSPRSTIIAMTAHALQGDRERCLDAGMDDYIPKPIRPHELQGVLDRWVPRREPRSPGRPPSLSSARPAAAPLSALRG